MITMIINKIYYHNIMVDKTITVLIQCQMCTFLKNYCQKKKKIYIITIC